MKMKKPRRRAGSHKPSVVRVIEEPLTPGLQDQIWRDEKVDELPDGISLRGDGRAGYLYFRQGSRFIAIDVELAGDPDFDIVLYVPDDLYWIDVQSFERTPLSAEERQNHLNGFQAYLGARGLRYSM